MNHYDGLCAQYVYGLDTKANRDRWEKHVRDRAASAEAAGLKIGSREHHDFVFGSYLQIGNQPSDECIGVVAIECARCGDTSHTASYHGACDICGSKMCGGCNEHS